MHPERKSLARYGGDRRLEHLEVTTQARPADDEEHVTQRVTVANWIGSMGLPQSDDGLHFGDHAPDQLRLGPAGDGAHMWQVAQRRQLPTAEVQTVKLHPI